MTPFLQRGRLARDKFLASLANARDVQRQLLAKIIAANADTVFGREHGFARIRDLDDYRHAVPVRSYDELRPFIERTYAGDKQVLTVAEPALFFATTGTTGAPKLVPVVREAINHLTTNQLVYWATLAQRFPRLVERDDTVVMLHLAPRPFHELSPAGVPVLNPTHVPAEGKGAMPYSRAPWFPPPAELGDADRLYFFLRHTVEHDLVGLVCLHPSRMPSYAAKLAAETPRLIRELHDGTMFGKPHREPNPARAAELERCARDRALLPKDVWPRLEFIASWYGGSFKMYAPSIADAYGAALIPHMSASSEGGHLTLPIDGEPMDGPLTIHANVYELLPVDESGQAATATVGLDEAELGTCYELVLTSPSGLYRYASGDRFEVLGFVDGVPRLGFVGRGGVVDMTGEKLTEQHVRVAIERTLDELRLQVTSATCCAVFGTSAHYHFVFEPTETWPDALRDQLGERLDGELRRTNSRYELKRSFGDLGAARVTFAARGAFERYRHQLIERGAPATQLKDRLLHADPTVLTALTGREHGE